MPDPLTPIDETLRALDAARQRAATGSGNDGGGSGESDESTTGDAPHG
eukprot:gene36456-49105_t